MMHGVTNIKISFVMSARLAIHMEQLGSPGRIYTKLNT